MDHKQFVRFMATGGVAAAVNLVSRYFFNYTMPFPAAVAVAYLCGMTTAYVLGRIFVFERSGRTMVDEFLRFTIVNLVAALQVWVISVALGEYAFPAIEFHWHPLEIAHVIGVIVPIFTSYFGHRYFSFAKVTDPVVDTAHRPVTNTEATPSPLPHEEPGGTVLTGTKVLTKPANRDGEQARGG